MMDAMLFDKLVSKCSVSVFESIHCMTPLFRNSLLAMFVTVRNHLVVYKFVLLEGYQERLFDT